MTDYIAVKSGSRLTAADLVAGAAIAGTMLAIFAAVSSGVSLMVTFAPGVAFTYVLLLMIKWSAVPLPEPMRFLPAYFLALAVQFLHFMEEFSTGFAERFPQLYGGAPYSPVAFVQINMTCYALFTLSVLAAFVLDVRRVLAPALFFVMYGVMGNAIAHPLWSIMTGGYFPGLFTATLYLALGPWLVFLLLGDWKRASALIGVYAAVLTTALTLGRSSV